MNVLLVIPSGHSMMVLIPLVHCSLRLLGFDELFGVIDRSHDIVVTCLLHHMMWNSLINTFHLVSTTRTLIANGLGLATCRNSR